MRRDGYLFLPGLLPRDDIAIVQRQIGAIARDAGWLAPTAPVDDAIAEWRDSASIPIPPI